MPNFKVPRPDKWKIPKPNKPHKPKPPKIPNVSDEIRRALEPVFGEINSVREQIDGLERGITEGLQTQINTALDGIEKGINEALGEVEKTTKQTADKVLEIEGQVQALGDQIAEGLDQGFGELVELVENGTLEPAFKQIVSALEKEIFEGKGEIKLRTEYLDIFLTDAKALARTIRDMINEGLPTSKREWRYIIVDLAPKAIQIKPGIPLIAQVTKKIPLEDLERKALEALLKKAGL